MYSAIIGYIERGKWKTITPMDSTGFKAVEPKDLKSVHEDILHVSKYEECSKFLGLPYIEDQIPENNIFIVIYKDSVPKGYIMANFLENNGVYLDVICAIERQGAPLLSMFIQLCKEYFRASYIQLSSLMHVLTYYPRLGFSHRKSCGEVPDVGMSPELAAHILDRMRAGVLTSDEDFFDDPKIAHFIKTLHEHGYTKAHDPVSCQDPSLALGHQKQRRCAKDGYKMIKCLDEATPPPPSHVVPFIDYVRTAAPRSTKPSRELQNLLHSAVNTMGQARRTRGLTHKHKASHTKTRSQIRTKTKSTGIASRSLRGSRGITGMPKSTGTRKRTPIPLKTIRE